MGATVPALRHAAEIARRWSGTIRGRPVVVIRFIKKTETWSQHAFGNATDFYAARYLLAGLAVWSAATAHSWSVATVIYNRRVWSYKTKTWQPYKGQNPHTTHVHIDYLPQWTGTPPGRPAGTPASSRRTYPAIPPGPTGLGFPVTSSATWSALLRVTLRRGSRGGPVTALQILLRSYGFMSTSDIDGIFGPRTRSAVARMQGAASIPVTGVVTRNDWAALYWGPKAWAEPDVTKIGAKTWDKPPVSPPVGELDHSWETTLVGLTPLVGSAASTLNVYARSIRSVTR